MSTVLGIRVNGKRAGGSFSGPKVTIPVPAVSMMMARLIEALYSCRLMASGYSSGTVSRKCRSGAYKACAGVLLSASLTALILNGLMKAYGPVRTSSGGDGGEEVEAVGCAVVLVEVAVVVVVVAGGVGVGGLLRGSGEANVELVASGAEGAKGAGSGGALSERPWSPVRLRSISSRS